MGSEQISESSNTAQAHKLEAYTNNPCSVIWYRSGKTLAELNADWKACKNGARVVP